MACTTRMHGIRPSDRHASRCVHRSRPHRTFRLIVNAQQRNQAQVADLSYRFVSENTGLVRALPLIAGGLGIVGVMGNRILSGIAPVVDASSSQSRADVIGIVLSASLLLTGLQWLSIKPKPLTKVELDGVDVSYLEPNLPPKAVQEINWIWRALQSATRTRSLLLFYQGKCVVHLGQSSPGLAVGAAQTGEVVGKAIQSGQGNYLPNLVLYPGRAEFVKYLPDNTSGVLIQPVGGNGALVLGTDTVRGFGSLDQAWAATIADKLDVTLEGYNLPGTGFGRKGSKPR